MKLLKMPSGAHQCLVYSLAMLLDEDVDVLIQELGHDGMVRTFPGPVPHCFNGYHIQEIIELCLRRGRALTPIETFPRYASALAPADWRALYSRQSATERFKRLINQRRGILLGSYHGSGHAVAWDGTIIWDPNGLKYSLQEFQSQEGWILTSHHK